MANAPCWTAASQVHVGESATVEAREEKAYACRAERSLAGESAAPWKKQEKRKKEMKETAKEREK
jgi:hypothetical protein